MSIFNNDCLRFWDGSFEIKGGKVVWLARIHPAIMLFNFLLPADQMTDNVLPLLQARCLLGGIPFQVATALCEEYRDARAFLAPMYAADMEYLIIFLTRKRLDLKPFEVLWCAAHTAVKINLPVYEKYKKIPMVIRGRVKRDAILAFRNTLHNPTFKFIGPLLGHALKALEVYIRPLVTDSSPFVWIDAQFLQDLYDIHELSVDGAKARKALFDYLQERHPGVETLWHSLVQMYNTYDVSHFPEYITQPISKPSLILWELFFRQAREDVPLEYPLARPSAIKRKDNPSTRRGPLNESEQKKSKNKKKNKSKGDRVVEPVEDSAVAKQPVSEDRPVPEEQPASQEQSASQEQPASQQQPSAAIVEIIPSSPTVQEPPEKSEQKQSKKDKKKMKKKLKKLEAAERTKSSVADECQPSVIVNDDNDGGNSTDNKDGNNDTVVGKHDGGNAVGNNTDGDNTCLTSAGEPANETSVNEDPDQEDTSDEESATQSSKVSVANVYAGILAEKRTLHGNGDNPYALEGDHAKRSDSWQKVAVRKDLQQKQRQRKNVRDIGKDVPKATDHVYTGAKPLLAKANAPVPPAKSLQYDAKPRPTKTNASVLHEVISESGKGNSNAAQGQPTSWSALFKRFGDRRRHPSLQHSDAFTNTEDAQLFATTGTESHGSFQEDFPPLNRGPLVQSETQIGGEVSKSPAAYSTAALLPPGEDDVPVDSPSVQETDMSHVEQWLMSRYTSAFVGFTQADT